MTGFGDSPKPTKERLDRDGGATIGDDSVFSLRARTASAKVLLIETMDSID